MRFCATLLHRAVGLGLLFALAMPAAASDKGKKKHAPSKGKPPASSVAAHPTQDEVLKKQVLNDLGFLFRYVDADKNNSLDEAELATAFRGKDAQPYAKVMEGKNRGDGETPLKETPTRRPSPKELKHYPDYVFLTNLDKDNSGQVNPAEFDDWAEDVANVVVVRAKEVLAWQKKIADLQLELARKTLPTQRKAEVQAELMKLDAFLNSQMKHQEHLQHLQTLAVSKNQRWSWWWWSWRR